jgi:hypothetical protein
MTTRITNPSLGFLLVCHARKPNFMCPESDPDLKLPWPDAFEPVALVKSSNLNVAFELTNHIDRAWQENETVEPLVKRARSTSVGDVILDSEGRVHRVANFGFVEEIGND